MDKRITNGIAIIVTIIWATSFVLSAIVPDYSPPVSVHAVMMLVAGAAFGSSVLKRSDDDNDAEKGKKKSK